MSAEDLGPDVVVLYTKAGDSKELFSEPLTYEAALKVADLMQADGNDVLGVITIEHADKRKAAAMASFDVDETHRLIRDELVRMARPEADRVRDLLLGAVARGDAKAIRSEGHHWSGLIAVKILELANRVEALSGREEES